MNFLPITYPLAHDGVVSMLQHYKISPTRQRVEIAGFLFQRAQHLSAETILAGVADAGNRVSRATVYNTMGLFARRGVVREILIDRERVFYDTNTEKHQHIYNIDTGELSDVHDADIGNITAPKLPDNLRVVDTDIVFKVSAA